MELTKYWPEDWRAVHTMLDTERFAHILTEVGLYERGELTCDGDCGRTWGEKRVGPECNYHTVFYCPASLVPQVLAGLRTDVDDARNRKFYVAVTDANDWSKKVNPVSWPDKGCPNVHNVLLNF